MAAAPSNSASAAALAQAQQRYAAGDLGGARQILQRALARDANNADLNYLMGGVLCDLGEYATAVFFIERAAAVAKDHPTVLAMLGEARMFARDAKGARASLQRSIEIDPDQHAARLNLALIDQHDGAQHDAEAHLRELLRRAPTHDGAASNLAALLLESARADEAWNLLNDLEAHGTATPQTARMLATISNYLPSLDAAQVAARHRRFGEMIEASVAPMPPAAFSREARPLRVGIMSPDFRQHSVAFFTEPLLHHADRTRFELRAYSSTAEPDATTSRLKPLFSAWIDAAAMGDALLAKRIRDDRVDVLIDLAGLTHGGRPGVLAVHPAPVSITYCGYPNSTGLTRIDARIVDSLTDPPGSDASATESLVRIDPCFLCYQGDPGAPTFDTLASGCVGHITFASFNVLSKINDATLRLWAAVLRATPSARLIIKSRGLDNASTRERFASLLAQHGIADRTELLPQTKTLAEHLATYGRVDIALDTFPYHGTTTTCEALWMGVPVVTMTGQTHASRVGASLLHAVGLDDLVSADEPGFAHTAVALAADVTRRLDLRRSLRQRMLASPLCDGQGFAARFWSAVEAAYTSARDRAGASA